ncbi:thiol-disulfide isomerase, partial [Vibrio parahaemolyticus]|nr:thiol-disulfide isomerase [Vibrio parahaemolyticus]
LDDIPDHDMMDDLFAAVQMPEGTTPAERKAAIDHAFHSRHIISPYDFNEMQQQQLMTMLASAEQMSTQSQINAVPTFIVNGKYLLLTSGHSDLANMAETLTYLLKQP